MEIAKKSLCVFIHFGKHAYIPKYVMIFLNELSSFFDQVILVTNQRPLKTDDQSMNPNLSVQLVKNEGYDLGMFYKAFQTIDSTAYSQIACINDSNILFNKLLPIFVWSKQSEFDFWGLIDSHEKPWFSTHKDNYHIQSHFIVFNQKAISKLTAYFKSLDFQSILVEEDPAKLRRTVINDWEIGLSQFLIREGLSHGSYIDSYVYSSRFLHGKQTNVAYKLYPKLIKDGFPLIKKKIITKSKWTDIFRTETHWENMIRQYGNQDWEIEALIQELNLIKQNTETPKTNNIRRKILNAFNLVFDKNVNYYLLKGWR